MFWGRSSLEETRAKKAIAILEYLAAPQREVEIDIPCDTFSDRPYDWVAVKKELPSLNAFLLHERISQNFLQGAPDILKKFWQMLPEYEVGNRVSPEALLEYEEAFTFSIERRASMDDESALNNPLYCLGKRLTERTMGEDLAEHFMYVMTSTQLVTQEYKLVESAVSNKF